MSGTSTPSRPSSVRTCAGLRRSAVTPGGKVAQHLGVPRGPQRRGLRLAARPGPDEGGQDLLRDGPVHRQPVRGELGAQQFGGRFGAGGGQRQRPVLQAGQGPLLEFRRLESQPGPAGDPVGPVRPAATDPGRAQMPVRPQRIAGVALVHAEQVERAGGRHRTRVEAVQPGPHQPGIGPPAAEQQPVRRTEVPACRQPHPLGGQPRRRLARPCHPPRPQYLVRLRDPFRQPRAGRGGPPAVRRGQTEAERGGDGQPDQVAAVHPGLAQRRDEVSICHGPTLPRKGKPGLSTSCPSPPGPRTA